MSTVPVYTIDHGGMRTSLTNYNGVVPPNQRVPVAGVSGRKIAIFGLRLASVETAGGGTPAIPPSSSNPAGFIFGDEGNLYGSQPNFVYAVAPLVLPVAWSPWFVCATGQGFVVRLEDGAASAYDYHCWVVWAEVSTDWPTTLET